MLNIRRFENGLQIVPNVVGNTAPNQEGEMAVWSTLAGQAEFSGTITGTSTPVIITANNTGSSGNSIVLTFTLTYASVTDTADTPNIVFTANYPGTIGNSISLVFNGIATVSAVTTAWNLANPLNTVNYTGLASVVPLANTWNLMGGSQISINTAISNWNTANPSNLVTLTSGDGTQLPSTQNLQLSGAGDGNIWYNNGSTTYPITAAIDQLIGDVSAQGPGIADATVNFVGGVSAAEVAAAVHSSQSGTPNATPNTLVLRDNTASFSANNITANNFLGNATTATLAGNVTGIVSPFNGGTGISNANSSSLTFANPFGITLNTSATTNLTLPVTGTLATLAGVETFSNKTFSNQQTWQEITTPVMNPPTGSIDIYAKSDNNIYILNSAGLESPLNSGINPVGAMIMFAGTAISSYSGTLAGTSTPVVIDSVNGNSSNTIVLTFNGTYATVTDTTETPNIVFTALTPGPVGNSISLVFNGVYATVTDTVDSPNIVFTANNAGSGGNSISLVFNGSSTIATVVNAWNTANPANQVSYTGSSLVIPAANTWTLSGGSGSTVSFVVNAWNTANPSNQVSYTGLSTVVPATNTWTLSGGSGNDINTTISNWNTANPSNPVVLFSGDGTQVPNSSAIATFSGSQIPAGWLLCDGSAVNRATYSNLFAVIGFNFGQGAPATQTVSQLTTTADVSTAAFGNVGPVTITAVNLGLIGNSISLMFNGTSDVAVVTTAWNAANPSNQVTYTGPGAYVPTSQTLNLANGASTTDGRYFEIYDDVGLVVPWIKTASTTMQPTVPGATRYIQINGIVTDATAMQVATAIAAAMAADSQFTPTTSSGNVVSIVNTSFITHPAGNAGTTPFMFVQTNSGGFSTFNIPDMRGLFPRGVDPTSNRDPDAASRTAINGSNAGAEIGSYQTDAITEHEHLIQLFGNPGFGGVGEFALPTGQYRNTIEISVLDGYTVVSTETRPKNLYVNYIIKF
jgi:microcystin-dependent protein